MLASYQKIAAAIVRIQSLGILLFALITLYGAINTKEVDSQATLISELIIYFFFVLAMWMVARGLLKGNSRAFGPFVLTQLFVIIVAWPLLTEGALATRLVGLIAGLSAAVALYLAFTKKFREEFFKD